MKVNDFRYYRVAANKNNDHLIDILNSNYYVELGLIDISILDQLLNKESIDLDNLYYRDLLVEGVGKITNDKDYETQLQFNLLKKLRELSTSDRLYLTIRTIRYNLKGIDTLAPVFLMPIEIDYRARQVHATGNVTINYSLINLLIKNKINTSLTKLETEKELNDFKHSLDNYTIHTIDNINNLSNQLIDKLDVELSESNYLTICETNYHEFVLNENDNKFFTMLKSLYSVNSVKLKTNYFEKVKGIIPVNDEEKYVSFMADYKANFMVNGKSGSGRTTTIKNIIGNSLNKNLNCLYVNQDSTKIGRLADDLEKLGLGKFIVNLNEEIEYNQLKTYQKIKKPKFDSSLIERLEKNNERYKDTYNGFCLREIYSNISNIKRNHSDLKPYNIETELEFFEAKQIYDDLVKAYNFFQTIKPVNDSIWKNLIVHKNPEIIDDVKHRSESFRKVEDAFVKQVKDFCQNYKIVEQSTPDEILNLYVEIESFNKVKPNPKWIDATTYNNTLDLLTEIKHDQDIYNGLIRYYQMNVISNYQKGKILEVIDALTNKYFNHDLIESELTYLNKLIKNKDDLEKFDSELKDTLDKLTLCRNDFTKIFSIKEVQIDNLELINQLLTFYKKHDVLKSWAKAYYVNQNSFKLQAKKNIAAFTEFNDKLKKFSTYFKNPNDILDLNNAKSNFEKTKKLFGIHSLIDNKKLLAANITYKDLVSQYNGLVTDINNIEKLISMDEARKDYYHVLEDYIAYVEFIKHLEHDDIRYYISFVNSVYNNQYYSVKNYLELVNNYQNLIKSLDKVKEKLTTYKINLNSKLTQTNEIIDLHNIHKYLIDIKTVRSMLRAIFKDLKNDAVKDIIKLRDSDFEFDRLTKKYEDNNDKYAELLSESYNGIHTDINESNQLIRYFMRFSKRFKDPKKIANLFKAEEYAKLSFDVNKLNLMYVKWNNALTSLSALFKSGLGYLQSKRFVEIDEFARELEKYQFELDNIVFVLNLIDYLHQIGLNQTAINLKNNVNYLPDRFYLSVLVKNQLILEEKHKVDTYSTKDFLNDLNTYNKYEQAFCEYNLDQLLNKVTLIDFDNYARIYLSDTSTFNNLDLTCFDLVLIDDAHLGNVNIYSRFNEAKQIIFFGDSEYYPSIYNTIVKRIPDFARVDLSNRYFELSNNFDNLFGLTNQFILNNKQSYQLNKIKSVTDFVNLIIKQLKNNQKRIVILTSNLIDTVEVYTEMAKVMLSKMEKSQALDIICNKIVFGNINKVDLEYHDLVYVYYHNINDTENRLVYRKFTQLENAVNICYYDNEENQELIQDIKDNDNLIYGRSNPESKVVASIVEDLNNLGINAYSGYGLIDVIIEEKEKCGIIINGLNTHNVNSYINEMNYYYHTYMNNHYKIMFIDIEKLVSDYRNIINYIVDNVKK